MSDLGMVYRENTTHQVMCELCKKVTHNSYRVQVGDLGLMRFCSGLHAKMAQDNYAKNRSLGVSPINPNPITDDIEQEGEVF